MTPPPRKRPRDVSASVLLAALDETEPHEPRERAFVEHCGEVADRKRLVEPQPEHHAFALQHVRGQLLDLAGRPSRRVASSSRYFASRGVFRQRRPCTVETAPMPRPR